MNKKFDYLLLIFENLVNSLHTGKKREFPGFPDVQKFREIVNPKTKQKQFLPPDVALVMAQAASFLVLNSALDKISMRTGKILASTTV